MIQHLQITQQFHIHTNYLSEACSDLELHRTRQHHCKQIVLHSRHTEIKMHQHFHQTASGQNLVSGLTFAITTHNQIDQTKATSPQCRLQALATAYVH